MSSRKWIHILIALLLFIALNVLVSLFDTQWDLTKDKRYSLSSEAKALLVKYWINLL